MFRTGSLSIIRSLALYMYVCFKTLFYVVRHLYSTVSYLPTGLHLGFFRSLSSLKFRRRIKATGKNKSVGPDRVSGEILKLCGEAMIPYLARVLDTKMNNGTLPGDWKSHDDSYSRGGAIDH